MVMFNPRAKCLERRKGHRTDLSRDLMDRVPRRPRDTPVRNGYPIQGRLCERGVTQYLSDKLALGGNALATGERAHRSVSNCLSIMARII